MRKSFETKSTCFIVVLCFLVSNLFSQGTLTSSVFAKDQNDLNFNNLVHIGMEQGLSSNKVNCIFQDKKGFIWIGTDYGLNRYDGYNFKLFLRDPSDSTSLTDDNITCITQDATGSLWIGTPRGLNVMNYKTEKIKRYVSKNDEDAPGKYNITALAADDNSVWIGTENEGLFQLKIYNELLKKYSKFKIDRDSLTRYFGIDNMIIENNGNVLAGNASGLIELEISTGKLTQIFLEKKLLQQKLNYTKYSSNDDIKTIYKDGSGNIYVGTGSSSKLNWLACDTCDTTYTEEYYVGKSFFKSNSVNNFKGIAIDKYERDQSAFLRAVSFIEYKTGKILCFGGGYCTIFNLKNNESQIDEFESFSCPKEFNVEKAFKDMSGKLWFITSSGIETSELPNFQFEKFSIKDIEPPSMVEDDDQKIWMRANKKSLVSFDPKTKKSYQFPSNRIVSNYSPAGISANGIIYGIGNSFDVFGFNKSDRSFFKISDLRKFRNPQHLEYGFYDLIQTSNMDLWVNVDEKGIGKIDSTGSAFFLIPKDTLRAGRSSDDFPYIDDGNANFYYANTSQIVQVNYKTNQYKIVDISKERLSDLSNRVTNLAFDKNKILWLGTTTMGLCSYNIVKNRLRRYTIKDGLPTNETQRILFVNNAIWVIHSNGIYKFIPPVENSDDKLQKPVVKNYGAKDGLPNINYSTRAMIQCRDGKILFSSNGLLISFYPDSIKSNNYVPPAVITSLQVNNKNIEAGDSTRILSKSVTSTDTLHLRHNQNNLSFEFAALNYIHSEANEYAYKMEGIDTGWIYCGKRRFVNYSNLEPGKYIFHVKAANNDGLWNETGVKLTIIIAPPWWRTWWAYFIYTIGLLLFIAFIIRLFTLSAQQKQKKAELSQKISETEMKALRSQMNPHFIFNALQSIQTFLLTHRSEEANIYLLKFSKLMRAVLENSQHSEVPLKEDIQALELYMQLESIRLPHPFTYEFHVDDSVDIENDSIPPLILQPFVENSVWHGLQYKSEPGHIDIFINKKDNALYATVEDNGVGRDISKQVAQPILIKKESLGIKLTEERLKILNEFKKVKAQFNIVDLFTNDNKASGTKVELSLPLV